MGIEDREYLRDEDGYSAYSEHGPRSGPTSIVTKIIIVTAIVYLLQLFSIGPNGQSLVTSWLKLTTADLFQRGQIWRILTYAFCHSEQSLFHILMNMLGLHFFGRPLSQRMGDREFLWFYLSSAVFAGICSLVFYQFVQTSTSVIGASGAVLAVCMLYAMLYPRNIILLFGVLPIEARWLVALYAASDAIPVVLELTTGRKTSGVAHSAHLGGLLFGFLYMRWNMHLTSWWDRFAKRMKTARQVKKSNLRVYSPPNQPESDLSAQMDAILEKISQKGEASLTEKERNILNQASKQLRKNREK
ncbi:MAG: rhomboid family intramembrane serine protease [Planctomyces sp.]|nr:rhomboid family intramembrane serine protease [Planctomyces sp.]